MEVVKSVRLGQRVYGRSGAYVGRLEAADEAWLRLREDAPEPRVFYVPRSSLLGTLPGGELFIDLSHSDIVAASGERPSDQGDSAGVQSKGAGAGRRQRRARR